MFKKRIFAFIGAVIIAASTIADTVQAAKFDAQMYSTNSIMFYDPRCSTETSSGVLTLAGNDNLEKILNFFMRKGLNLAQASGIVGNMMIESRLEPAIIQGGEMAPPGYLPKSGIGFGLVQWTSKNRQDNMVIHILGANKAREVGIAVPNDKQTWAGLGVDITDLSGQLDFTWEELSGDYSQTLTALKATDDPVQAAVIVHDGYERSADSPAKVISHRGGNSKKIYDDYIDREPIGGSTAPPELRDPDGDTTDDQAVAMSNQTTASNSTASGSCIPGGFSGGDLSQTVAAYAWPEFIRAGSSTSTMSGYEGRTIKSTDMTDTYADAVSRAMGEGRYVGGTRLRGVDCGGFVTLAITDSGFDKGYNNSGKGGNTVSQEAWLRENWQQISATDASDRQPGDVAINAQHTYLYIGDLFDSKIASASWDERAPMQGS